MPIEIKVTKELGNFEPKFIGPFTVRQTIVFGCTGAAAILLYKAAGNFLPKSMQWYACLPAAAAAMVFNMPFYGMRFEQFLKAIFVNVFLAPANRRYRTQNTTEQRIRTVHKACDEMQKAIEAREQAQANEKTSRFFSGKKKSSKEDIQSPDAPGVIVNPSQSRFRMGKPSQGRPRRRKGSVKGTNILQNYKVSPKAIK